MKIHKTALIVAALVLVGLCDPCLVARDPGHGSQVGPEKGRSGLYSSSKSLISTCLKNGEGDALDSRPGFGREKSNGEIFPSQSRPDLPFSDPGHDLRALLEEANTAFQQANAAADPSAARQSYDKAILLYEKIIRQGGVRNAGLYYNLANAYLLKDDLGRAILNYRRAERLNRSDLNIRKNLAFARSRRIDRVEIAAPRRVLETLFFWHYDLSLQTRFLLAGLAFAALCISLTVMIWLPRQALSICCTLSAALALVLFVSILVETRRQSGERFGVITAAEVVARQGDGPNYPPSFKDSLHAGTEFDLLEQRPGWFHIRLSDGADAWVPEDAAELG